MVVSDIGLEDGSGLEIGRRASAVGPRPRKLIALSGYGSLSDIGMSLHAGFDEHLVKPVSLDLLDAALDRLGFGADPAGSAGPS